MSGRKSKRPCAFTGCRNTVAARDLCDGHRRQSKLGQPLRPLAGVHLSDAARFARFVSPDATGDGCRLWIGATNHGYGYFSINDRPMNAHRAAWLLFVGPIPHGPGAHGTIVRHRCDTRACVNVEHLELGSQADNIRDAYERGRIARDDRNRLVRGPALALEAP